MRTSSLHSYSEYKEKKNCLYCDVVLVYTILLWKTKRDDIDAIENISTMYPWLVKGKNYKWIMSFLTSVLCLVKSMYMGLRGTGWCVQLGELMQALIVSHCTMKCSSSSISSFWQTHVYHHCTMRWSSSTSYVHGGLPVQERLTR